MEREYAAVSEAIQKGEYFFVISHVNPDGDSIGSMAAMSHLLQALRKRHVIYSHHDVPLRYEFLLQGLPQTREISGAAGGVVLSLDCSDLSRLGELQEKTGDIFLVNIDHHVSNNGFGRINLVDGDAAATGEIIHRLAGLLGVTISAKMAEALYTSISTDTGSFKYDNTTARTFSIMADLMKTGFNLREVSLRVFDQVSLANLCVLREGLKSLQLSGDGRVASMMVHDETLVSCQAKEEDLDGLINHCVNIHGVEVGLLFRVKETGDIKVGFRSKGVDVSLMAASLGGGGHKQAAGCTLEGPLEEVKRKVMREISAGMKSRKQRRES